MTNRIEDDSVKAIDSYTDADFKRTIWSALRLMTIITVVAAPLADNTPGAPAAVDWDATLAYRRKYGSDTGSWTTDHFVEVVFKELTTRKK